MPAKGSAPIRTSPRGRDFQPRRGTGRRRPCRSGEPPFPAAFSTAQQRSPSPAAPVPFLLTGPVAGEVSQAGPLPPAPLLLPPVVLVVTAPALRDTVSAERAGRGVEVPRQLRLLATPLSASLSPGSDRGCRLCVGRCSFAVVFPRFRHFDNPLPSCCGL